MNLTKAQLQEKFDNLLYEYDDLLNEYKELRESQETNHYDSAKELQLLHGIICFLAIIVMVSFIGMLGLIDGMAVSSLFLFCVFCVGWVIERCKL